MLRMEGLALAVSLILIPATGFPIPSSDSSSASSSQFFFKSDWEGFSDYICPGPGKFTKTDDCRKYYQCMFKGMVAVAEESCDPNQVFDESVGKCVAETDETKDCSGSSATKSKTRDNEVSNVEAQKEETVDENVTALTPSGSDTNGKPSTSMGSSSEKLEVSAPTNNQGDDEGVKTMGGSSDTPTSADASDANSDATKAESSESVDKDGAFTGPQPDSETSNADDEGVKTMGENSETPTSADANDANSDATKAESSESVEKDGAGTGAQSDSETNSSGKAGRAFMAGNAETMPGSGDTSDSTTPCAPTPAPDNTDTNVPGTETGKTSPSNETPGPMSTNEGEASVSDEVDASKTDSSDKTGRALIADNAETMPGSDDTSDMTEAEHQAASGDAADSTTPCAPTAAPDNTDANVPGTETGKTSPSNETPGPMSTNEGEASVSDEMDASKTDSSDKTGRALIADNAETMPGSDDTSEMTEDKDDGAPAADKMDETVPNTETGNTAPSNETPVPESTTEHDQAVDVTTSKKPCNITPA